MFMNRSSLANFFPRLSKVEFMNLSELKIAIEAFGIMKGSLNANEQDFEKIEPILKQLEEEKIPKGDLDQCLILNRAFHDSLFICSNNQKLINLGPSSTGMKINRGHCSGNCSSLTSVAEMLWMDSHEGQVEASGLHCS
jgi:DNA-binding FadR family transcriptional regulator